ncbi:hypothetical protein CONLIGDRAFT_681156 [Coniochaeta ligniaria NRRL 30616]|uniref:Rhodopsin domain-containing protein n=1 Tax=Coniochaeta ligniaria NRRL 30616 TaxID=1408157 RepID=A0A1J7IT83_9PEZI|nr:hypothetical protein CONLIGDRAFT_681156 [Coniochaeta ligniaria NRRL 30616]
MPADLFTVEAWTYNAIDIVVVAARVALRGRLTGWRNMAPDDILMIAVILLYTAETATAHYVVEIWHGLANSGMTDAERAALDPNSTEYYFRVKGSQTQLFGWLVYIVLLWTLKAAWLFFYRRLGTGVDRMPLKINIGFGLVGATFFATFFTVLAACPIEKHWQINPDPGNICQPAVSRPAAFMVITTNLVTDFYIMAIPFPMIWSARISMTKKVGLLVMFSGGLITAVFGGLRCGYILQNSPQGPKLTGEWSCRESFVAVFISNFPVLFPFLHRAWLRSRLGSSSGRGHSSAGGLTPGAGNTKSSGGAIKLSTMGGKAGGGKKGKKYMHPLSLPGETFYDRFGSEEEIIEGKDGADKKDGPKAEEDINVTTEWRVQSHEVDAETVEHERRHRITAGYHAR